MGGVNPYLAPPKAKAPTEKYRVTFLPLNVVVEVDPKKGRQGHDGLPFSILDIAEGAGVDIDHSCGGVCACSTCHVYIRQGLESCPEATEDELDQLDNARGLEVDVSRLSCQCVPDGSCDVVVEIPGWNRNLARE
jgi:2Fe-2S ferredoxin